jgi:hypothetical protein
MSIAQAPKLYTSPASAAMDRVTKLTLVIVAGVVAIYALLSYARHTRAPSLGRATTEQSSLGFETRVVAESL